MGGSLSCYDPAGQANLRNLWFNLLQLGLRGHHPRQFLCIVMRLWLARYRQYTPLCRHGLSDFVGHPGSDDLRMPSFVHIHHFSPATIRMLHPRGVLRDRVSRQASRICWVSRQPVRYQDPGSVTGLRLSTIFLAVSWEMLGRKTTRQLHVPPLPGTLALYAVGSSRRLEVLSW